MINNNNNNNNNNSYQVYKIARLCPAPSQFTRSTFFQLTLDEVLPAEAKIRLVDEDGPPGGVPVVSGDVRRQQEGAGVPFLVQSGRGKNG